MSNAEIDIYNAEEKTGHVIKRGVVNRVTIPELDPCKISTLNPSDFSLDTVIQGPTDSWKENTLFLRPLSPDLYAAGIQKTRPYALCDLMLLVLKKGEIVRSVSDIKEDELNNLFRAASRTLGLFNDHAEKSGETISLRAVSVNFDTVVNADPETYPRSAQSIWPLHMHVVALTDKERQRMNAVPLSNILTAIRSEHPDDGVFRAMQYADRYEDPMLRVLNHTLSIPAFNDALTDGLQKLHLTHEADYEGINFWYRSDNLDDTILAQDIQTLVLNAHVLYDEFRGYARGMGLGVGFIPENDRVNALDLFAKKYNPALYKLRGKHCHNGPNAVKAYETTLRFLDRLSRVKNLASPSDKGRYLRDGFAYTLSIIRRNGDSGYVVNFAPRFFSDGNLLAFLRIERLMDPTFSADETYEQIASVRKFITERF